MHFFTGSHNAVAEFFFSLHLSLIFSSIAARLLSFASSHQTVPDFSLRLRQPLNLFTGRACRWFFFCQLAQGRRWLLFQIAPIAFFSSSAGRRLFLPARTSPSLTYLSICARWFFPRLSPSLTSFSGCARRGIFSQVAPVADCVPGCACRWLLSQIAPVADIFCQLARIRRWLLCQCAHIADFFPGRPRRWVFSRSHQSVAYFFFSLRPSLTFFTGCARRWFFPRLRMSPTFLPACTRPTLTSFSGCTRRCLFRNVPVAIFFDSSLGHVAECFFKMCQSLVFSQVKPVADFFFRLRLSLTLFTGRACRWFFFASSHKAVADFFFRLHPSLFFQVVPVVDFFCQLAQGCRWLLFHGALVADSFHRSSLSLIFFLPARTRPSLISFSDCTHRFFFQVVPVVDFFCQLARVPRWLLFQVAPVAEFFHRSRLSLIVSQVAHVAEFSPRSRPSLIFFPSSHESVADFFVNVRTSLTFSQVAPVADFFPGRSSPSLISFSACSRRWLFSHAAPVADFFPGCACRRLFCQLAQGRRWLLFQVASVAVFSKCACR